MSESFQINKNLVKEKENIPNDTQLDEYVAEALLAISGKSSNRSSFFTLTPTNSSPEPKHTLPAAEIKGASGTVCDIIFTAPSPPSKAFAKLIGTNWSYYLEKIICVIGRQSDVSMTGISSLTEGGAATKGCEQTGKIDVLLNGSKLVSRRHAKIEYNFTTTKWEILCCGRNGISVDSVYYGSGEIANLSKRSLIEIGGISFYFLLPQQTNESVSFPAFVGESKDCEKPNSKLIKALKPNISFSLPTLKMQDLTAAISQKVNPSKSVSPSYASNRPPKSYAALISEAINSTVDKKMTLSGIYAYLIRNYPYFMHTQSGWQNSIRHNLSLNKAFKKIPRSTNEPGKGMFWIVDNSNPSILLEDQNLSNLPINTLQLSISQEHQHQHQEQKQKQQQKHKYQQIVNIGKKAKKIASSFEEFPQNIFAPSATNYEQIPTSFSQPPFPLPSTSFGMWKPDAPASPNLQSSTGVNIEQIDQSVNPLSPHFFQLVSCDYLCEAVSDNENTNQPSVDDKLSAITREFLSCDSNSTSIGQKQIAIEENSPIAINQSLLPKIKFRIPTEPS